MRIEYPSGKITLPTCLTLPYFFTHLQLQKICCEPYAQNPSPNKGLAKAGFTFIKQINATIPGLLNFEQTVAHWK